MINRLPNGLPLFFLALLLTGCASCPAPVQNNPPPTMHLLMPTPPPTCTAETNADMLECVGRMRNALDACNADKITASDSKIRTP